MAIAVVGVASIWGGVVAWSNAAAWTASAWAAGAMVVGGAMTTYGAATDDKNMMENGMLIGAVGSLGTSYLAKSAATETAKKAAEDEALKSSFSAGTGVPAAEIAPAAGAGTAGAGAAGAGAGVGTGGAGDMAAVNSRYEKLLEATMKQNTQSQMIGMAGQAASGYMQAQKAEEIAQRQIEAKQAEDAATLKRRSNAGLTLPTLKLPRLGLLNAEPQTPPQVA